MREELKNGLQKQKEIIEPQITFIINKELPNMLHV